MAAWNKLKVNARLSAGQNLTILVPSQASRRVARNSPGNASKHQRHLRHDRSNPASPNADGESGLKTAHDCDTAQAAKRFLDFSAKPLV
jgi:hypothetical protein